MQWSQIPFSPNSKTLRQFAGLWILFFGGLALWQTFHLHRPVAGAVLGTIAVTIGIMGLISPKAIRPIFVGWMILVFPIGWVISHVIMLMIFYGIFTPIGLFFRLTRRDALSRRSRADVSSYWVSKPLATDTSSYFRPS